MTDLEVCFGFLFDDAWPFLIVRRNVHSLLKSIVRWHVVVAGVTVYLEDFESPGLR